MPRFATLALILAVACPCAGAQQLIGYVNTHDADVSGASDVLDGQAVLTGSVSVTAKDHTAAITMGRGGTVRVCQTSELHLTEGRTADMNAPLLFALDRGAIEIQMNGTPNDAIMTPDLRFTVRNGGALDLRMRVARNGDTCVENRGPGAPTLAVSDPFGEAMYELAAGQHVLFEHGSLREVVDHESSPCGCPDERGMSVAEALLAPGAGARTPAAASPADQAAVQAAEQAAARAAVAAANQHPFPAAVSEGLAPPPAVAPPAPGVQTQVTDALRYPPPEGSSAAGSTGTVGAQTANQAGVSAGSGGPPSAQSAQSASVAAPPAPAGSRGKKTKAAKPSASATPQTATASAPPGSSTAQPASQPAQAPAAPAPAPPKRDLAHVVGRFFKRLFGG